MDAELVKKVTELERRLDNLDRMERGWVPTFLTTPLTNASFNGDSFSDVGALTKIENTSWSSTIPATAKALIIFGECRDSGSAATAGLNFALWPASGATQECWSMSPSGQNNDGLAWNMGTVICTDGDVWYTCNASGASTLDVWLWCFGYWT